MDQLHTTRRSASHGALNNAYSSQEKPMPPPAPHGSLRPRGQYQSLRSLKENNPSFLSSPGPLESMLKTTTETGDIGIFSIGPASAHHLFRPQSRSRTGISEANRPRRSESREHRHFHDDRRRLPSYRDTTSEILSLYGSESQRSACSSLSRRFDDTGPRTYSLTSCSSRQFPNHMPNGLMHGQQGAGLQRPRSPFPYPARLRRPGVRPSSPALTENGSVDYSRMVGIDRGSYRTAYGSYRPSHTHNMRRPPPLSLRADSNHSARSPRYYGSFPQRQPPPDYRNPYSMRPTPGPPTARERARSASSDQSTRTSSLTSIIDKYRRSPAHSPIFFQGPYPPPSLPSGPFYYDYTEEFENAREVRAPPSPIAPVPTRAPSTRRPMVLREDCEAQLEARLEENQAESEAYRRQRSMSQSSHNGSNELLGYGPGFGRYGEFSTPSPLSRGPVEDFISRRILNLSHCASPAGTQDSVGSNALLLSGQISAASKSPERQVEIQSPGKTTIRSVQASILGAEDQEGSQALSLSTIPDQDDGLPAEDIERGRTWNNGELSLCLEQEDAASTSGGTAAGDSPRSRYEPMDAKLYSTEHGLSGLASLVENFDNAGTSLWPNSRDDSGLALQRRNETSLPTSASVGGSSSDSAAPEGSDSLLSSPKTQESPLDGHNGTPPVFRHHRREAPNLKVDTLLESASTLAATESSHGRNRTPMLAPKPISPAKELRVKNSIPRLMKALPPLPGDKPHSSPLALENSNSELELSTLYSPVNLQALATPKLHRKHEPMTMDLEDHIEQMHKETPGRPQTPRFKVRVKNSVSSSSGTVESRPWNKDKNYPWTTQTPDIKLSPVVSNSPGGGATKPRLKLRMARNIMESDSTESLGTVRRMAGAEKHTQAPDIAIHRPEDMFISSTIDGTAFTQPPFLRAPSRGRNEAQGKPRDAASSSAPSTPRRSRGRFEVPSASAPGTPSERGTFVSESDSKSKSGLRKKFSNLKKKFSESHLRQGAGTPADILTRPRGDGNLSPWMPSHMGDFEPRRAETDTDGFSVLPVGGFRRKISRWVKGAKHIVRACVRRRRGALSASTNP